MLDFTRLSKRVFDAPISEMEIPEDTSFTDPRTYEYHLYFGTYGLEECNCAHCAFEAEEHISLKAIQL